MRRQRTCLMSSWSSPQHFQPAHVNYGLVEPLDGPVARGRRGRMGRRRLLAERALANVEWCKIGHGFAERAERPVRPKV